MSDEVKQYLVRQLDIAWALTEYHLNGLTTDECLWRPASVGLHVWPDTTGGWRADWPERESYDLGPSSIAWLTWHLGFWWSMALDHAFGTGRLAREDVIWPGTADDAREWVHGLHADWRGQLDALGSDDLGTSQRTRWPFRDRPFGDVVAWANVELMKSAAEIGYVRFLYAARRARAHAEG